MNVILGDLQANDYFNIISFSDTVSEELEAPYRPPPRMFKVPRTTWATWKLMVVSVRPTYPYGQAEVKWEILERLPSYPHLPCLSQCLEYHYYILHKYMPCILFPSGKNIADSPCILGHIPLWTGVSYSLKHILRRIC